MRKVRILITGTNTTLDNGETAISATAIKNLKKMLPNSEFIIGSTNKLIDCERWRRILPKESPSIGIVSGINSLKIPRSIRAVFVILRYILECLKADLCLDISGDGYSDLAQGRLVSTITHSIQLLIGILQRKPVVIYAQSIGLFKTKLTRLLAKFVLNKVTLITVREELTEKYLKELGIGRPLIVTSDSAFLLEPISPREAELILANENIYTKGRILVGMTVSQIIHKWMFPNCKDLRKKYDLYTDIMARVSDYLVEKLGATVILIPQSIGRLARHDDRIAAIETYQKTKYRTHVKVILRQHTPQELKGIIGRCELMISSKMHSAIAAISMLVPTLVLAYSHKTHGIFAGNLGLEELIIDLVRLSPEELLTQLISKIDYLWGFKDQIVNALRGKIIIEKEKAILNVRLVANLIDSEICARAL